MCLRQERNRYVAAAALTALFAAVYECFSHQVYSRFMLLAFLIPLLGGALPMQLLLRVPERARPGVLSRCLYASGLATLTAGSLFLGILEIYGTTSRLSRLFLFAGAALLLLALGSCALRRRALPDTQDTRQLALSQQDNRHRTAGERSRS